ncbi:MAG: DUF3108 domain-containing protein [Sulfuricurvum sp.]|nr:DUF3108 domain-containing protein [Sulfuricurvum sp.]
MQKMVWILMLFAQIAGAKVLSASYEVSFGIFQTMGTADARFELNDDQTYKIRVEARTTGLAKALSNNRIEVYESVGTVKNGKLIPSSYMKIRKNNSKKNVKLYTFDHINRIVWKEVSETKEGKEHKDKDQNEYYAQEDILSLFFNLKNYTNLRQNQAFYAIGGNKTDGRIDVVFPKNKELVSIKKVLEKDDGDFLKVILNDRIFESANGELFINLNNEGLCEKAVLADVLLFGDIVGKRVR